ncbi:glycosyltransferase family 8 protein [Limosilactobacillus ingluviei]
MTANATIFIINHSTTPVAALKKSLASVQQQLPTGSEVLVISAAPLPADVVAPTQVILAEPTWDNLLVQAQAHGHADFITFLAGEDFFMADTLPAALDELDQKDVELGTSPTVHLQDGMFTFHYPFRSELGFLNTNNVIPAMRSNLEAIAMKGVFFHRRLLNELTLTDVKASSQRLFYFLVHAATKGIFMTTHCYCLVTDQAAPLPAFHWEADYEYSPAYRWVKEIQASGYQATIPARVSIALCIDNNIVDQLLPLLASINQNTTDPTTVYIVAYQLSAANQARLQQLAALFSRIQVAFRPLSKALHQMIEPIKIKTNLPIATYTRVLLPYLFPELDRLLYLDTDTLVLNSLHQLWHTDLAGHFLGAGTDISVIEHYSHQMFMDQGEHYFNSGVLLMDLHLIRQYQTSALLIKTALDAGNWFIQADQDAHNLFYFDAYYPLEMGNNYGTTFFRYFPRPTAEITVLHYYVHKPWKNMTWVPHTPRDLAAVQQYRRLLRQTHLKLGDQPQQISVILDARQPNPLDLQHFQNCLENFVNQDYTNLAFLIVINAPLPEEVQTYLNEMQKYYPLQIIKAATLTPAWQAAQGEFVYFFRVADHLRERTLLTKLVTYLNQGASVALTNYQRTATDVSLVYTAALDQARHYLPREAADPLAVEAQSRLLGQLVKKVHFPDLATTPEATWPARLKEQSPLTCYLARDPWVWHFKQHPTEEDG